MNLAAVYSRVLDDEELIFASSGWTYRDTFVLYDLQTESLWYHLPGTEGLTCIAGVWRDRILPEFPTTIMRWRDWKAQKPQTLFWDRQQSRGPEALKDE